MYSSWLQSSVTSALDLIEKRLRRRRLRGVEPAGEHDGAVRAHFDCEHALPLLPACSGFEPPNPLPVIRSVIRLCRRFLRIFVLDGIRHASDQVQPEPARLPLLDRRIDVDVRAAA